MNILVVEDDIDIGSMLSRGLRAEGFDVTLVERADEALQSAKGVKPGAVVLDMMLPDGSGRDVCRTLRDRGYTGPILFLSAKDEVRDRAERLSAGADDYVVKPFRFDEFLARLRAQILRRGGGGGGGGGARRLVGDLPTRPGRFEACW